MLTPYIQTVCGNVKFASDQSHEDQQKKQLSQIIVNLHHSIYLCFIIVFICDLFVFRDDPLMS